MASTRTPARRAEARRAGDVPDNEERPITLALRAIDFTSSHQLLKACAEDVGWKNAGRLCATPDWTPDRRQPISLTMGERLVVVLTLAAPAGAPLVNLRGQGPGALRFAGDAVRPAGSVQLVSSVAVPRRIARLSLGIDWSTSGGDDISPARSENVAYVIMARPADQNQGVWAEDGVTLKRMDLAVSWVEPLRTLRPHAIVRALMDKFPYYSLKPSPKVPRQYRHPTYFNDEGGAWPMADYVEETGECQAIVRLVRAILRQLGVPGEARALVVWADPEVEQGKKAISAFWDDDPGAGLSRVKNVNGKRWVAALSDGPVEVGKEYPASHSMMPGGKTSPGMNRYEACLEFTHEGVTRQYGGGAGVFTKREDVLRAFWGLVWVSGLPNEGFRVEEIVTTY